MNWHAFFCHIIILTTSTPAWTEVITLNHLSSEDQMLANPWINSEAPTSSQPTNAVPNGDYDFIIVGAGSAGSVIASRLSEIGAWRILVLEAGLPESSLGQIPALSGLLQFTNYNWAYETEPEHHACFAMKQQRCPWPRGKALGGSSSINGMFYTRGVPEDYDRWAALGNTGWSFADVLPYFLKSEDARLNNSAEAYHNTGGYLGVETTKLTEYGAAFISAGLKLGYNFIDHNSDAQLGFSRVQLTTRQGRRQSSSTAFLLPVLNRKNLSVLTGAKVTKVMIDPLTNTAYGIEYLWRNEKFTAKSNKEVILSAGVIGSAQLLMLSGIGPKKHLDKVGIVTLHDLPVGKTLYDHIAFSGVIITTNITNNSSNISPLDILRWYNSGEGPLSSFARYEALALIKTYPSPDENYPDIEISFRQGSIRADNGTFERRTIGISDQYYNQMYMPLPPTLDLTIDLILLHPRSSGYIKLKSANPLDYPLLYGNYFTDSENHDARTLVAGIRTVIKLAQTEPFKKYNAQIYSKPFVGCEHYPFGSDEHWECAIKSIPRSANHQTSTCKMGPPGDPTAVVDSELRVYGVKNLRVADASVMPLITSSHTNAAAMMIGEKVSDLIKQDWGNFQVA